MKNQVQSEEKASTTGTFLRGFRSGATNSGLMLGIFSGIGALASPLLVSAGYAAIGFIGWPAIAVTVLTTGIFSGVLGVKKAKESTAEVSNKAAPRTTHIITHAHSVEPSLEQESGIETRSDWAERTGRSSNSQSAVQQILANGSLSDKDRASAILAARENSGNSASLG